MVDGSFHQHFRGILAQFFRLAELLGCVQVGFCALHNSSLAAFKVDAHIEFFWNVEDVFYGDLGVLRLVYLFVEVYVEFALLVWQIYARLWELLDHKAYLIDLVLQSAYLLLKINFDLDLIHGLFILRLQLVLLHILMSALLFYQALKGVDLNLLVAHL